ncbi:MAG TPA: helix-turn-helix domain-containing protein [Solirubrobacteraceae bacterium]|jgi:AcrR family transcriptional regulator
MAAPTRTPRASWVQEGLRALGEGGPDAVRIEKLAQALGVTKGGFYWHFAGRGELLVEMLDAWERLMIDEAIERVEAGGGDARAKLRRLSVLGGSGGDLIKIELAMRDWARRDEEVAGRVRRMDNRRMEYMRSLFAAFCPDEDEIEVRCMLLLSLWVANPLIAADHGARRRADVVKRALSRLEA